MGAEPALFYHHEAFDCYECLDCGEFEEVPVLAPLRVNGDKVPIKCNPENRLLWIELMEKKHARCKDFQDTAKAAQARTLERGLNTGSRAKTTGYTSLRGSGSGLRVIKPNA
jgi:hypothetical protein